MFRPKLMVFFGAEKYKKYKKYWMYCWNKKKKIKLNGTKYIILNVELVKNYCKMVQNIT